MHLALRAAHISAGSISLVLAVAALTASKGSRSHKLIGRGFVVSGRVVIGSALVSAAWGVVAVTSFVGDEAILTTAEERAEVRLFFAILGVLGLLAGCDLESGVDALRASSVPTSAMFSVGAGLAGTSLLLWGGYGLADGRGGLWLLAIVVGLVGVDGARTTLTTGATITDRIERHFTGMIGAAGAFLAAFSLFGLGQLVAFDFFGGDVGIVATVSVVVGGAQLLIRWWRHRWATQIRSRSTQPARRVS